MKSSFALLLYIFSILCSCALTADAPAATKTWRTVAEFTPEERKLFDTRTATPARSGNVPICRPNDTRLSHRTQPKKWAIGPWSSATPRVGRAILLMSAAP